MYSLYDNYYEHMCGDNVCKVKLMCDEKIDTYIPHYGPRVESR